MKLITQFELASCNKNELHALHRSVFNELAQSNAETTQRRNALASLENIQNEINARHFCP